MQKHLLVIGFMGFSSMALAANMTAITIGNVNTPVHVAVFRGMCSNLDMGKLKSSSDFPFIEGKSCEFITNQTLNPKQPKKTLNTWHQGSVPLLLVAFQDGQLPIKCLIDDRDKLYVTQGPNGLACSSTPNVVSDDAEAEVTQTYQDGADINVNGQPVESAPIEVSVQKSAKATREQENSDADKDLDMDPDTDEEPMDDASIPSS